MTTREACNLTGIAYSTLYGNLMRGNLNGRMIDGRWDFSENEIYDFALYAWSCRTISMYPPSRIRANFISQLGKVVLGDEQAN